MTARLALLLRGLAVLVAVLLVVTIAARHVPVVPDLVLVLVVAWALLRGPVAVVRGVSVELVCAAELGENLHKIQLVRLEPVDEIIVEGRIGYDTISAGPNTEADE